MNESPYLQPSVAVGELDVASRARFISRTYGHLVGAILLFTLIEMFLFETGAAATIARSMLGVSWLLVLGGFVVVSWLASRVAHASTSRPAQYAALAGVGVGEGIMFWALVFWAN